MAGAAQQGEIVDVCRSFAGFRPRNDVMGLAAGRFVGAEHASPVACHEGPPLRIRGGALAPAVPQRLAVAGEQHAEDLGIAGEAFEFAQRDRPDSGNLAPSLRIGARHHVGRGHDHDLMARRDRQPTTVPLSRGRRHPAPRRCPRRR